MTSIIYFVQLVNPLTLFVFALKITGTFLIVISAPTLKGGIAFSLYPFLFVTMKPETQAKLDQYLREKEAGSLPSPVMAHGPGGLMSHPGMGDRKRRRAEFLHTLVNKMKINQKKAIDLVNAVDKMRDAALAKKR